jgi:hypothetical protein
MTMKSGVTKLITCRLAWLGEREILEFVNIFKLNTYSAVYQNCATLDFAHVGHLRASADICLCKFDLS